eukprot:augustus_masked-scaffold_7-processed-gene-1.51-mRNA-1 protein AED:1.00 eAED:1.00 QI:0/0/0/0/1/1/2/0/815
MWKTNCVEVYFEAVLGYEPYENWGKIIEYVQNQNEGSSNLEKLLAVDSLSSPFGKLMEAKELLQTITKSDNPTVELLRNALLSTLEEGDLMKGYSFFMKAVEELLSNDITDQTTILFALYLAKKAQLMALLSGNNSLILKPVLYLQKKLPNIEKERYFNGMLAFGYEQNEEFKLAEETARLGLSLEYSDGWCDHALLHSFYFQGKEKLSDSFTVVKERSQTWNLNNMCNFLFSHLWWHYSLLLIETGYFQEAQLIYKTTLWPSEDPVLELNDTTNFHVKFQIIENFRTALTQKQDYKSDVQVQINSMEFLWRLEGASNDLGPILRSYWREILPVIWGTFSKFRDETGSHGDYLHSCLLLRGLCKLEEGSLLDEYFAFLHSQTGDTIYAFTLLLLMSFNSFNSIQVSPEKLNSDNYTHSSLSCFTENMRNDTIATKNKWKKAVHGHTKREINHAGTEGGSIGRRNHECRSTKSERKGFSRAPRSKKMLPKTPRKHRRQQSGSSANVIRLLKQVKGDNNKLKLENQRQRKHLRIIKLDRDGIKKKCADKEQKLKKQVAETSFWVSKAEKALLQVKRLKSQKVLCTQRNIKTPVKIRSGSFQGKLMTKSVEDKKGIRSILLRRRGVQTLEYQTKEIEMKNKNRAQVEELEDRLSVSFQNYSALQKTHERALRELRRSKTESTKMKSTLSELMEKLDKSRNKILDLTRQVGVLQMKLNQVKAIDQLKQAQSEDELGESRETEPDPEEVSFYTKDKKQERFKRRAKLGGNLQKSAKFHRCQRSCSESILGISAPASKQEPAVNLVIYDKYRKLKNLYRKH